MLSFRAVPIEGEPARSLVEAMRRGIAVVYDRLDLDGPDMPKAGPRELGPPTGRFLVGFDEGDAAVCCGGVKDLGDGACEITFHMNGPSARAVPADQDERRSHWPWIGWIFGRISLIALGGAPSQRDLRPQSKVGRAVQAIARTAIAAIAVGLVYLLVASTFG